MTNDKDITLADIFAHIRVQTVKIDRLTIKVDALAKDVSESFEAVDKRLESIEQRLEYLEQDVFILVAHKKAHEERLNSIEKEKLPKVRKSIRNLSRRFSDHTALPSHQVALKT